LVDGVGGQMARFEVHAIAHDHDAVERQPKLGTTLVINWSIAYS
jgi:hypothetical protein